MPGFQEFMSELKSKENGFTLSKPFLYQVSFSRLNKRLLTYLCHSIVLPGWMAETQPTRFYGLTFAMPTGLTFGEFRCAFYVDRSYQIPLVFKSRMSDQFDPNDYSPNYLDSYSFVVDIDIFDVDNQTVVATYVLENAYVANVAEIQLDYSAQNQVTELTVQMGFEVMKQAGVTPVARRAAETPQIPAAQIGMQQIIDGAPAPLNFATVRKLAPDIASKFDLAKIEQAQSMVANAANTARSQLAQAKAGLDAIVSNII